MKRPVSGDLYYKVPVDDEKQLIRETAHNNEASFSELVLRYKDKVRIYVSIYSSQLGEEVDDLAQDVFVQVFISAKRFNGDSSVKTWIYSIAKNTINNKLRKKKLIYFWQLKKKDDEIEGLLIEYSTPESITLNDEKNKQLIYQLNRLDLKSKEVLMLFQYSGFSYEQIATILNVKIGTVKSRINLAKVKLKMNL